MLRDFEKEEEIRILIDNYRKCSILALVDFIGVSRKFWYDVIDSRVMPNRDNLVRLVEHLEMYQEDATRLFMLNGYVYPWNTTDYEVFSHLKKRPSLSQPKGASFDEISHIAS